MLLGILGVVSPAVAQESPSLRLQREAQEALAHAIDAMGGQDALGLLRHARIELSSRLLTEGQGLRPDTPRSEQPAGRVLIQLAGSQASYQTFNGEDPNFRVVTGDAEGIWVHFAAGNTVASVEPAAATLAESPSSRMLAPGITST